MIPPARRGGRPREVNVREVVNGIFYILWTGCQWSALLKDLPPKSTVAPLLHAVGVGRHARAHPSYPLRDGARLGRARSEPIGGGHRQPERQGGAKSGSSLDPQGFDAGKKVTGRKRHILVDTLGLLLSVIVHPADVQDRDGARELLRTTRGSFPFIETIIADGGYQGPRMAA